MRLQTKRIHWLDWWWFPTSAVSKSPNLNKTPAAALLDNKKQFHFIPFLSQTTMRARKIMLQLTNPVAVSQLQAFPFLDIFWRLRYFMRAWIHNKPRWILSQSDAKMKSLPEQPWEPRKPLLRHNPPPCSRFCPKLGPHFANHTAWCGFNPTKYVHI